MLATILPSATPLDHYLEHQGLDHVELELLLDLVDAKLLLASPAERRVWMPCREAIIGELRALG